MRLTTTDQATVAVLLSDASANDKKAKLDGLLSTCNVANGLECPECFSHDVGDNACRGVDLTFLCKTCGHQWSPNI